MSLVPRGRLAPSPTGLLHLGHARTFLLAWWHTRSRGGSVVLRMDDLDSERVRSEFIDAALFDLEWLGIDWDAPVVFETQHQQEYATALAQLERLGLVYPCVCTRKEIAESIRAPHQGQEEPRYAGTCRGRFATLEIARAQTGRAPCLRFTVPEGEQRFVDQLTGPQRTNVAEGVGDFVVARRDGIPAYQLAVVVDDQVQGINEVVRGADLLESTARQQLLQSALNLPHPTWYHVPLVEDAAGVRLAKRSNSMSLKHLREQGTDARHIVAWAARSAGLTNADSLTPSELLPHFDIARINRRNVPTASVRDPSPHQR